MKNTSSNKADKLESAAGDSTSDPTKSIQLNNPQDLNAKESKLLSQCEQDIQENIKGFFISGYRLAQIRDERLYRATYKTFEEYCLKRWEFSKTHANRLIQAHICEKHLKSLKDARVYIPTKESQVRFIADLEPEQQVEVASEVFTIVGKGDATAKDFGSVREKLFPKPKAVKPKNITVAADEEETTGNEANGADKVVPIKFDTKLVSLSQLHEKAQTLKFTFDNSAKKKDNQKLIEEIEKQLKRWAAWESENKQEVA